VIFSYRDEIAHHFENVKRVRRICETVLIRVNGTDTYNLFRKRELGVITFYSHLARIYFDRRQFTDK
jgi:hypothetical protein